jgi:DNA-binding PadR family transcriptional regulator
LPELSIWRSYPLFRIILEEALKNPRGISEDDIMEILRRDYKYDVSKAELYEALLRLELRGYIVVEQLARKKIIKPSPYLGKLL